MPSLLSAVDMMAGAPNKCTGRAMTCRPEISLRVECRPFAEKAPCFAADRRVVIRRPVVLYRTVCHLLLPPNRLTLANLTKGHCFAVRASVDSSFCAGGICNRYPSKSYTGTKQRGQGIRDCPPTGCAYYPNHYCPLLAGPLAFS